MSEEDEGKDRVRLSGWARVVHNLVAWIGVIALVSLFTHCTIATHK